jgi:plasmid stabilization system protein ParE
VARVIYTPAALHDLERLVEFLLEDDPPAAIDTIELVSSALEMLGKHPLLGRATQERLRELVISRGKSGYLALYHYEAQNDLILVLGVRHQREAGYSDPAVPD